MKRPAEILTREEARSLFLVKHSGTGFYGARARAMYSIMYRAGARVSEVVQMRVCDYGRQADGAGLVRIAFPKGWRREKNPAPPRTLGIDKRAAGYVDAWIERYHNGGPLLFHSWTGLPVDMSTIRKRLRWIATRARVPHRVHPHALRHTFAIELYEETEHDILAVMRALGHRDLATTTHYLNHLGVFGPAEMMMQREW